MVVELWLKSNITGVYTNIDLGDDTSISLNKSFEEIDDFSTRTSSYTKTFSIPQSSNNDRFFRSAFMVNSSSFADNVVVDAVVKYGGADVFVGQARLSSINNSTFNGTYDIFLTQSLPDFSTTIQNIKLIDLDYSNLTHTNSYDNVASTWSYTGGSYTNYTGLTGTLLYPLAHYGYDDTQYYGLFSDGASGFTFSGTPITTDQFAPWVNVKYLVDRVFERANFTYTSDFFETDYFKGIFGLAKTTETMGVQTTSAATENANTFLVSSSAGFFDNDAGNNYGTAFTQYFYFNTESSDPLNIFTPSLNINNREHFFTSAVLGVYTLKFEFSVFLPNTSFPLYLNVAFKDLDDGTIYGSVLGMVVLPTTDLTSFTLYFTLNLPAGRRVGAFYSRNQGGGNFTSQIGFFRSTLELLSSPPLPGTNDVLLQNNIPGEITCLDFFKGIVELFNLVVIPDGDRNLRIEKWDDYFSSGLVKDWSDKIDLGSGYSLSPTNELAQEYIVRYEDSDDRFSRQNQQDRNQQFGTFRYISNVPYHTGVNEIIVPFQPLPISTFDGTTDSNMLIPHLYQFPSREDLVVLEARQAAGQEVSFGEYFQPRGSAIRLGFYQGLLDFTITGATKTYYILSGITAVGHTTYPAISHLSSYEFSASTFSDLNIGNQYDYWQPTQDTYVGFTNRDVWNNFWSARVEPLYDNDTKILRGKFKLTPTDINNLQFNDRVYFLEAYWRLLSMTDADITEISLVDCEWIKLPYYPEPTDLIPPTYEQSSPTPQPLPTGSTYTHNVYSSTNTFSMCNQTAPLTLMYSNCSTLSAGCSVFSDTGATTPISEGTLLKPIGQSTIYQVIEYGIITNFQNC